MNSITWEMRYGLPNQQYLDFVARSLLSENRKRFLIDPFALVVPVDLSEGVYVARQPVEEEMGRWDTQIVLGGKGGGKTTLFDRLPALLPDRTLVIQLSPASAENPLDRATLASAIFDTYWRNLLQTPFRRGRFLPRLRQDREWMAQLRWFYHQYTPIRPEIPAEFELMTWLADGSTDQVFSSRITSEDVLRALVNFVISPPSTTASPYVHIQVLVDDADDLLNLQRLYDLNLDGVSFKLFADLTQREWVEGLDCVRCGQLAVYSLPLWQEDELRRILYHRLKVWVPGDSVDLGEQIPSRASLRQLLVEQFDEEEDLRTLCFDLDVNYGDLPALGRANKARELVAFLDRRRRIPELIDACEQLYPAVGWRDVLGLRTRVRFTEFDWGERIPESHLTPRAQTRLVDAIVTGALRTYDLRDEWDAPVHALRLARALVAACAGCWAAQGYAPPLNTDQLYTLVDLYWKSE